MNRVFNNLAPQARDISNTESLLFTEAEEPFPHISRHFGEIDDFNGNELSTIQKAQWESGDLPGGRDLQRQVRVLISGAGVADANGVYLPNGKWGGHLWWINPVTKVELWYNSEWRIGNTSDYYYRGSRDVDCYLTSWYLGGRHGESNTEFSTTKCMN
jgi:hypothetical protein